MRPWRNAGAADARPSRGSIRWLSHRPRRGARPPRTPSALPAAPVTSTTPAAAPLRRLGGRGRTAEPVITPEIVEPSTAADAAAAPPRRRRRRPSRSPRRWRGRSRERDGRSPTRRSSRRSVAASISSSRSSRTARSPAGRTPPSSKRRASTRWPSTRCCRRARRSATSGSGSRASSSPASTSSRPARSTPAPRSAPPRPTRAASAPPPWRSTTARRTATVLQKDVKWLIKAAVDGAYTYDDRFTPTPPPPVAPEPRPRRRAARRPARTAQPGPAVVPPRRGRGRIATPIRHASPHWISPQALSTIHPPSSRWGCGPAMLRRRSCTTARSTPRRRPHRRPPTPAAAVPHADLPTPRPGYRDNVAACR